MHNHLAHLNINEKPKKKKMIHMHTPMGTKAKALQTAITLFVVYVGFYVAFIMLKRC